MATERIKADQINPESAADNTVLKVVSGVASWGFPSAAVAADVMVARTTSYTAAAGDFVLADASSNVVTVTLPNTGIASGSNITIKKMDPGPNYVNVQVNGGGLIDGESVISIISQGTSMTAVWTGTTYVIKLTARDDPNSLGYSGALVRDRVWLPSPGVLSIDEFNNDSLDPAWVRVDNPTGGLGRVTWAEGGDTLSALQAGGDAANELHGLLRPLSGVGGAMAVGDAFTTAIMHFGPWATTYTMGGILLTDGTTYGAGTQVYTLNYVSPAPMANDLRTTTNFTTAGTATTATISNMPQGIRYWVRLMKASATTYRIDTSPDGVQWVNGTTTVTSAFTPTHVGLLSSSWGTAIKSIVTYEFLRRMSGVS